ncbi:MAG: hypothetical protein OXI81_07440 [Paracoccaceae bacterium]|nr:hypothetical protein [Paracoccaceae bacterium]
MDRCVANPGNAAFYALPALGNVAGWVEVKVSGNAVKRFGVEWSRIALRTGEALKDLAEDGPTGLACANQAVAASHVAPAFKHNSNDGHNVICCMTIGG